jgi:hypothetical protein
VVRAAAREHAGAGVSRVKEDDPLIATTFAIQMITRAGS